MADRTVGETRSITEISRALGMSTRMLRYYERMGLVESRRRDGYAYRVYDGEAVARLRQIALLRKLRIPLREIGRILLDGSAQTAFAVLAENLRALDGEIEALSSVRAVLAEFVQLLEARYDLPAARVLLDDESLSALVNTLSPPKTILQEERTEKMEKLEQAQETMGALRNVRIVHLPASTVAAAHFVGEDPENRTGEMIAAFARAHRLWEKIEELRLFGFNHPNPVDETGAHGYEFWLTIPDDTEVEAPLVKKHFPGGMYAAHAIRMGDFHEWAWLDRWVRENGVYEYCGNGDPEVMFGSLEEHLNYFTHIRETPEGEPEAEQLDLLIPVRKR